MHHITHAYEHELIDSNGIPLKTKPYADSDVYAITMDFWNALNGIMRKRIMYCNEVRRLTILIRLCSNLWNNRGYIWPSNLSANDWALIEYANHAFEVNQIMHVSIIMHVFVKRIFHSIYSKQLASYKSIFHPKLYEALEEYNVRWDKICEEAAWDAVRRASEAVERCKRKSRN